MAKKQFKAESKRLLDLMINSIYTNKEIFLRELISNASDATDKRYYENTLAGGEALNRNDLPISIAIDKDARKLVFTDNGCGMTKEELESNLGIIAQSGSLEFKKEMQQSDDVDIIGQFGVGFYSAFMVSDKIEVTSRTQNTEEAFLWLSDGADGYTITTTTKPEPGTLIELTIKAKTEEEDYDRFLDENYIIGLVKKHSDYIRYPIQMEVTKTKPSEEEGAEPESYTELETLNSMTPIWKKRKSEVSDEDYNTFYKDKFFDYSDPLKVIYTSTEGLATYNALLFVPAQAPFNYHSKDYKKGLQLYASGVLIMEHCADLLPDYFGFMRGVVDSQDLSLNISREMLQQDSQLRFIAGRLEKKIQAELLAMLKNERENYIKMFDTFGVNIKYGVYEGFGAKKELLQDLLMFDSSIDEKTTLQEYIDRMREEQKYIYYATAESIAQVKALPAVKTVKDKGFEILYFTNEVDEFAIKMLGGYNEKEFRSVTSGDLGIDTKEEKQELEEKTKSSKELLEFIKEALGDKVSEVELTGRSGEQPACITAKGEVSLEMEKTLSRMPGGQEVKAQKVLEINPENELFKKLETLFETNKDGLQDYITVIYNQARLLEGLSIENMTEYNTALNKLLVQ